MLDFGAEYANYSADCSRTIPVNGRFSSRQKDIYDANLRVFRKARALIRPGTTIDQINKEVAKLWEEEHIRLGLYSTRDVQEQHKGAPLHLKYLLHGVSHFLGLDVHDVCPPHEPFAEGMVFTIEPGIYIREEGLGVRLENDVRIGKDENVDLMESIPIEAGEIEELMNA